MTMFPGFLKTGTLRILSFELFNIIINLFYLTVLQNAYQSIHFRKFIRPPSLDSVELHCTQMNLFAPISQILGV